MGVVYRGEDIRLGREVAIKFVSEDATHGDQAVLRLRSEARAASALNHPNICTIYDIGEDEGHPFIVMELMKGQTLRERLASGPLKVHQLVDIGIEISDALHATHQDGIIHRDIKPGNIFLTDRGHVKVLDFGLAKLTPRFSGSATTYAAPDQTGIGVTIGTVSYMSPEQAAGESLDGRTDLFSLGVVLYECATGRHPFPGKTSAVILASILNRTPVAPITINPELPVRLQEVINNCLEKDRELRYQSAADLRADLKRLRRDLESGHSRPVDAAIISSRGAGGQQSHPASGLAPVTPVTGSRRAGVAAAAVSLMLLAGAAYLLWWNASRSPAEPPAAAMPSDPSPNPPTEDRQVEDRLSLARSSLEARNYRAAVAYAGAVLEIAADHAEARRIRDEAREAMERFDEAIAAARTQLARGDVQAAARSLQTARALDPSAPEVADVSARITELTRQRDADARAGAERQASRASPPSRPGPATTQPPPAPPATTGAAPATPQVPAPTPAAPPPAVEPPSAPVSPAKPEPRPSPAVPESPPPGPVTTTPPAGGTATPAPAAPALERPPSEARPPEPGTPAPSQDEADEAAIRRVVATYGRAIEGKDLDLFRSIKPNLSRDEERRLEQGFRAVTSQRVALSVASIDRRGDTATVVVQRRDVLEVGGRQRTVDAKQVLTLGRTNGGWVIVQIR